MGRRKKPLKEVKNEKVIEKMASIGATNLEIAEFFGIDENTLKRNFEIFLTKGRADLKTKLRRKQISVALSGNVMMLIWLGKQILGQKDKLDGEQPDQRIEVVIKSVE